MRTRQPSKVSGLTSKQTRTAVMQNLQEWNTPRSLSIYLIMKYNDDKSFLELTEIKPEFFNSATSYAEFAFPTDLVRKSRVLNLGVNTRAAALASFHNAELLCQSTNRRLQISRDPYGRLGELIHRVRKILLEVLPTVNLELLDSLIEQGGWGKGVTSSAKARSNGGPNWLTFCTKLVSHQHATTAFLPIARELQKSITGMTGTLTVQDYNEVAFVPKNAKTDRAIAVEPSLNSFVQRGVGVLLRRALRRLGVDLIHGQSRNAALAKRGSETGEFATVDLSMASDTMAYKLISYLLPDEWVHLLRILRTPCYRLDGKVSTYHKFSSMGNGYTFELESLIFSACAKAVAGGRDWAVYGDDIIVPSDSFSDLADLLSHLGFVLNEEKTFSSGPFRESCGKDYFLGVAVRGLYLKEMNPATPFVWHNWLAADRLLPNCPRTMNLLRKWGGNQVSPFPDDGAFWAAPFEDHARGLSRGYKHGRKGWYFNCVVFKPITRFLSTREELAAVGAYCRLAQASEPTERVRLEETLNGPGKWGRRRIFIDDEDIRLNIDSWPRS